MSEEKHTLLSIFPGLPRTTRGKPIVLHTNKDGSKFLYCNGNSIFIRDVKNPADCDVYTQHAKDTTCAAYAPSGYYIASGDLSGKIRIWDTVNKEHILKYEYQPIAGAIKDIAWTEDSKRIAICGEGREKYAMAFLWDSGSSVGDLTANTKFCNSIDIKQTRPYRLCLASEDYTASFFEGPPFKYSKTLSEHTNFVNCCRFSPDGAKFATAGADGKCFIYDGKTGELEGELCESAGRIHKGGVYALSWSPDSKKLMSVSADKTVKVFNLSETNYLSNKEEASYTLGNKTEDMQVGGVWAGEHLISVSLSGYINFFNLENTGSPSKVIKGHSKAIVASSINEDRSSLYTASFDGVICCWNISTGMAEVVSGTGHQTQVTRMHCQGDTLMTCSLDDTVRYISTADNSYTDTCLKLDSQPRGVAQGSLGLAVVACIDGLVVIQDKKITHKYKNKDAVESTCVDVNSNLGKVAVGTNDLRVVIYDIEGDQLKESLNIPINGDATDVKFSPNGEFLAISSTKKQVKVILTSDFKTERANWGSHAVRVNSIAWTPDSKYLASCGTDGVVMTWNIEMAEREALIRGAHALSIDVTSVQWSNDNTLLTTGRQDCSVRMWQIKH